MNRLDRALAILLLLRGGEALPAAELAKRFEVSVRTIYRDIEMLAKVGVPVYAEMGRGGGFRLSEGYFLPPVMFSTGEAVSLLVALTFLKSLPDKPYAAELETAEKKLLAAMPEKLQNVLADVAKVIGFEDMPHDIFHPEQHSGPETSSSDRNLSLFFDAVLQQRMVRMTYQAPYSRKTSELVVIPQGILWDRQKWYLAGHEPDGKSRLWRADRVVAIRLSGPITGVRPEFDIHSMLGRKWLDRAMEQWRQDDPVTIRISPKQAERLMRDWYYSHAHFERLSDSSLLMTFGEDNRDIVLEIARWLGTDAELISPQAWREILAAELKAMLARYEDR